MREELRQVASKIDVCRYFSYLEYLRDLHAAMVQKLGRYSVARFSEDLGMGPHDAGRLLLTGRRKLTRRSALRIIRSLDLSGNKRKYFWALFQYASENLAERKEEHFRRLRELQKRFLLTERARLELDFFNSWVNAVVFEVVGLGGELRSAEDIRSRMRFPAAPAEIQASLDLLERLELIVRDSESGCYIKKSRDFVTGDDVLGLGIVSFHRKMMELARESLEHTPAGEREISAVTLSVSHKQERRVRHLMKEFQTYLLNSIPENEEPETVIQLNFQLFPLTKKAGARK